MSQYSAGRRLMALAAGFQDRLNPHIDIDLFYQKMFDLYTAEGFGLDNWGVILGVGRNIPGPYQGDCFGLDGSALHPFNQYPFVPDNGTPPAITMIRLDDEHFRLLLLYKALANISASDAETQNRLLNVLVNSLASATLLREDSPSAGLGVWGPRPQEAPGGAILTPEEIRQRYGPARTLGASPEVQAAADAQLDGAGVYDLIQHSFGAGLGLGATPFPGYPFLAGLTQNGLVAACVDTVADEMTRAWIKLTRRGEITDRNGNGQDDDLDALGDDLSKFKLQSVFHRAAVLTGYYGGCLIFIDAGAAGADLKLPLNISEKSAELGPGSLRGFTIIEPINVFPGHYNSVDPLSPHYFRPSTWWVQGREVHASRLIQVVGNLPPVILRPSYNFFGIPLAQILHDYVLHFQECRLAAQRLLTKFSLTVLQTDMSAVLTGGPSAPLERRLAYFVQNRSNDGCLAIDKETENILNLTTPLSGVTDIVKQALELIACIAKVPAVKLLGISPSGFNATGESDLRNHYDHVAGQQEKILRPGLETALKVIQLNRLGGISPDIGFTFNPLSKDDEQVQANIRKTRADTAAVYVQAGVVAPAEVRAALVQDPDSGFDNLKLEGGEAEMEAELAKIFGPGAEAGPEGEDRKGESNA